MRIAINGFGRIGRAFLRAAFFRPSLEIVAVNDLGALDNLAYLLRYDSVYGQPSFPVVVSGDALVLGEKRIRFFSQADPAKLPWKNLGIDLVVESTGVFNSYEKAKAHIFAGARRVVISAPARDDPKAAGVRGATVLVGVNEGALAHCELSANGSCTTNAASPIVAIFEETLDIEKALLDTIHGYTSSQSLVDGPSKRDFRRGRAAAINIVPSSTGAAFAVTQAVEGVPFFDGIAVRVPIAVGSYVDLTFVTGRNTSAEEVNEIMRRAAATERWQGIFAVSEEPLVSSDIIGRPEGSIADLAFTRVAGGNLVKVLAWYDNEFGYANTLVRHVEKAGEYLS